LKSQPGIPACSLESDERLTSEQWSIIAKQYTERMGLDRLHPWIAVRHGDTARDHIHIMASRLAYDGTLFLGRFELFRAIRLTQMFERQYGLEKTQQLASGDRPTQKATPDEINTHEKAAYASVRQQLQDLVNAASTDHPTVVQFCERLHAAGVQARANVASTGTMNGFSFELKGISIKGSSLGDQYRWASLQKLVTYDQAKDYAGLALYRGITRTTPNPAIDQNPRKEGPPPTTHLRAALGMTLAQAQKAKNLIRRSQLPIQHLRFDKETAHPDSWVASFQQEGKPLPTLLRTFSEVTEILK
jgi:hypothetical protein